MVVFLLLVIIAILLFGSGVVVGWIGFALGLIVLVIALTLGVGLIAMVPVWVWWTIATVVGGPAIYLLTVEARKQERLRRTLAEATAKAADARRHYEALKRGDVQGTPPIKGPDITFHNDGLNKKKRKQQARQKLLAPENQRMRMD